MFSKAFSTRLLESSDMLTSKGITHFARAFNLIDRLGFTNPRWRATQTQYPELPVPTLHVFDLSLERRWLDLARSA